LHRSELSKLALPVEVHSECFNISVLQCVVMR
jgi:hypothetical protein